MNPNRVQGVGRGFLNPKPYRGKTLGVKFTAWNV